MRRPVLALAALLLPSTALAVPATWNVNDTADSPDVAPGNGNCATAAGTCTLRAAIDEANAHPDHDTILLPAGVFNVMLGGVEDANAGGDFDVNIGGGATDGMIILGAGAGLTIIDGNQVDRVFEARTNNPFALFALQDLTVTDGFTATHGGGVRGRTNVEVTLQDVEVDLNEAAGNGGGVAGFVVKVRASVLTDNVAGGSGGGLATTGPASAIDVADTTFDGNEAGLDGGGFFAASGGMVGGSTFSDNRSLASGGGLALAGVVDLVNVTVSGNDAVDGGGIAYDGGGNTLDLDGVTVVYNTASNDGGGLITITGTAVVENSILGGNTAGVGTNDCFESGGVIDLDHSLLQDNGSCFFGNIAGNQLGAVPLLGALTINAGGLTETHLPLLVVGNPVQGTADPVTVPATDQNGTPRGAFPDMGACEG